MEVIGKGKPILYSYFQSSCCWRVRIALALKKIDYVYRAVHIEEDWGEQFSEEFTKLNPCQEVPVFVEKGHVLSQSVPIIEYLEETRPDPPLLPSDPIARVVVRGIVEQITSGVQPLQTDRVLSCVGDGRQKWAKYWIERGFAALEVQLRSTSGTCCLGDSVTIADLCLIPQVFSACLFNVDMSSYPTVSRISSLLSKHEDFLSSHPYQQPDCPQEYIINL